MSGELKTLGVEVKIVRRICVIAGAERVIPSEEDTAESAVIKAARREVFEDHADNVGHEIEWEWSGE